MADKKPVVIGGLPHKAMLVAALGQTTPAPGDMSARLREVLSFYANKANYDSPESNCGNYYLASEVDKDKGEKAREAIAALSALPAADVAKPRPAAEGVVELRVTTRDPDKYTLHNSEDGSYWRGTTEGTWVRTTPPTDAAVGAQGDGEEAAIDRMIARYLELEPGEKENGVAADYQPTRDFCRELLRAAAPAAGKGFEKWWHENCDKFDRGRDLAIAAWQAASSGKGVDDANSRACIRFVADDGSTHASPEAADRHNALTRQPVAGDEWQTIHVKGWDDFIGALERADRKGYMPDALREKWDAFDYRTAPAATPTDGGEGK